MRNIKTNDHVSHDYNAGKQGWKRQPWEDKFERNVDGDELTDWGIIGIVAVGLSLVAVGALIAVLIYGLFFSPPAAAWEYDDGYDRNGYVQEYDLGGGIRQRSGTIDGKRYQSQELDLGGGIRQESGRIGDRSFHCETLDLGTYSTTRCW